MSEPTPEAARSATFGPLPHRSHIGVEARRGAAPGADSPLITIEDAEMRVSHHDASRNRFLVAGYAHPAPGQERSAWMQVFEPGALGAVCDFRIEPGEAFETIELREVVGVDDDRIYLLGAMDEGDERLLSASYRFLVEGP